GVDEAMGAHQVDPEVCGTALAVGQGGGRSIAILSPGEEVTLKGKVGDGMANREGEEQDQGRSQVSGGSKGQSLNLEHASLEFAAALGKSGDRAGRSGLRRNRASPRGPSRLSRWSCEVVCSAEWPR